MKSRVTIDINENRKKYNSNSHDIVVSAKTRVVKPKRMVRELKRQNIQI